MTPSIRDTAPSAAEAPQPRQLAGELERLMGYRFKDASLAVLALTHRSHAEGRPGAARDYQRLEFLGDAVVRLVVSEEAFRRWPEMGEGQMSELVSRVVSGRTLARAARACGLGRLVLLGKGQEAAGGRDNASILADVFEACVGAVYVDEGLPEAAAFVRANLGPFLGHARGAARQGNYKSVLQEKAQGELKQAPVYELVDEAGPAHDRRFTVRVSLAGRLLASGDGPSKRAAEQDAARRALATWPGDAGGAPRG